MPVSQELASRLKKLSAREKAAVADHLWREVEAELGPTPAQISELDARAGRARQNPRKLKPVGDAVRRLRR